MSGIRHCIAITAFGLAVCLSTSAASGIVSFKDAAATDLVNVGAHRAPVCIGGIDTDGSSAYSGNIDDVRITMRLLRFAKGGLAIAI